MFTFLSQHVLPFPICTCSGLHLAAVDVYKLLEYTKGTFDMYEFEQYYH